MTFTANIPLSGESLGSTRDRIRANFQQIQSLIAQNHIDFNTSGQGKHTVVQTVDQTAHPTTAANEPAFYGTSVTGTSLGVLQYSRGASDAVPSPITKLQSVATPILLAPSATTNILDFTNIPRAIVQVFAANFSGTLQVLSQTVFWNGTTFLNLPLGTALRLQASGNILQIANTTAANMNDVYWTADLKRVS